MNVRYGLRELEQLMGFAEELSTSIEKANTQAANLRSMAMLSIIGFYAAMIICYHFAEDFLFGDSTSSISIMFILATLLACGAFYFFTQYFSKIKRLKKQIDLDREMLSGLLDTLYEFRDHLYVHSDDERNVVEQMVINMRIQRIKFSSKW